MTKGPEKITAHDRRRRTARLTVIAGSALTLAVSWLGVVQADDARPDPRAAVVFQQPASVTTVAGTAPAPVGSTEALVPAPTPTRQVIVVRRSRAS